MPFAYVLEATLTLTFGDRVALAHDLLQSVEEDPEYEREVMEEVMRRYREVEEGSVELISGEEFFASLREEAAALKTTGVEILTVAQRKARAGIVVALNDIRREAMELSEFDRAELAYAILRDLDDEGFKVDWETLQLEGDESRIPQP